LASEPNSQKRLGVALFYGIVIVLAYLAYLVFEPFLPSLSWAVVLVVFCYPVYARLARRWGPTMAAFISTAGVTLILIVPTLLVMAAFVHEGVDAARSLQNQIAMGHFRWVNDLWMRMQQRFPQANSPDLATLLHSHAEQAASYLATQLGAVLRHTALFLFRLGVAILAMFYLFRDGESIMSRLRRVLPFEEAHRDRMLHEGHGLIFASLASSVAAAAAQGVLGGLAFAVTRISSPVFWGVMMGFFSLVPIVGSALIWVPASISLFVGGHIGRGILFVILCIVIVFSVDNLIRPWLISGRTEMGGLVVFISVLGGINVFGMLGVVLGPIIAATAASLLDLYAPSAQARNNASKASGRKTGDVLE
jgi:predicted PurR-regulated permease PerM